MKIDQTDERLIGMAATAGAYLLWGILPLYWKLVNLVSPFEILAQRITWSFFFMVLILLSTRKLRSFLGELYEISFKLKKLSGIAIASLLISVNWLTYIWAVNSNHIIETSLGYYINPLVSVLLGVIVLKERLSFWQMVSFFLAMLGVLNLTFHFGSFPWVALVLAITFGLYGLCKKMIHLGAITGITLETLLVTPLALLYLNYVHNNGVGFFGFAHPGISGLLAGAGVVTAVPLILFASGARRLPLSTMGFLQYIAPTIALFLGVFIFHEPFTAVHMVSFTFIWAALTVFSLARTRAFIQLESVLLKNNIFQRFSSGKN
ncbi:MAG: EamA family transporter RarD [Desulfotomaculaceae bacterium]|nr:EamA family transporter RarD [Desulfotomaculaceae bacterium]